MSDSTRSRSTVRTVALVAASTLVIGGGAIGAFALINDAGGAPDKTQSAHAASGLPDPDCHLGTSTIGECLPDPILANAVARQVGKEAGNVMTAEDVAALTHVEFDGYWDSDWDNQVIGSLAGIEVLEHLQVLDMPNNQVASAAALANLTKLESVDLSGNRLASLEGFGPQTELRELNLSHNRIREVDTEALAALTKLGDGPATNVGDHAGLSHQIITGEKAELDDQRHFWVAVPKINGTPVVLDPTNGTDIVPESPKYTAGDEFVSFFADDADHFTIATTEPLEIRTGGEPMSYSFHIETSLDGSDSHHGETKTVVEKHGADVDTTALVDAATPTDPETVKAFELLHTGAADPTTDVRVVMAGSSTAAGGVVPHKEQGFSYRLGYRLGGLVEKLDDTSTYSGGTIWYHGAQGGTTSETYLTQHRMDQIAKIKPHYVIHQVGSNDWGTGNDPDRYAKFLRQRVEQIEALSPGVQQVLIHQQPRFDIKPEDAAYPWAEYGKRMEQIVSEGANRHFLALDAEQLGYDLETGSNKWGMVARDRIHLMAAGNRMLADYIGGYLGIPSETGTIDVRTEQDVEIAKADVDVAEGESGEIGTVTIDAASYPRQVRLRGGVESVPGDKALIRAHLHACDQKAHDVFPLGHEGVWGTDRITTDWVYLAPGQTMEVRLEVESQTGETEVAKAGRGGQGTHATVEIAAV